MLAYEYFKLPLHSYKGKYRKYTMYKFSHEIDVHSSKKQIVSNKCQFKNAFVSCTILYEYFRWK